MIRRLLLAAAVAGTAFAVAPAHAVCDPSCINTCLPRCVLEDVRQQCWYLDSGRICIPPSP
jgi:hypothetical protein